MNQRKEFLQYFFASALKCRYCLLKFIHGSIDDIPEYSDVDLLVLKKDLKNFEEIIRNGKNIHSLHFYRKSFVSFVSIVFEDGNYLEIDLIHRFERKGIIYLNARDVIHHTITNENKLKIASIQHTFEYIILFYLINNSQVPERYTEYFGKLSQEERRAIFGYIFHKYNLHINTLDELYTPNGREAKKLLKSVDRNPNNRQPKRFLHSLRYLGDAVKDLFHSRGYIITFSGVDGAGKSTLLNNIHETLQKKYRQKIKILRHRPSLLPILSSVKLGKRNAELKASSNLPRQGNNKSSLSSFFRFMYYYSDYLIGQFYVHFFYTLRGYTVLYDRYYFDFIIDAKRSNIILPKKLMKIGYYFLLKPKMNVFLYAPADIIRSRKQELNENDIQQLSTEYRELFEELGLSNSKQKYLVINNTDLNQTHDLVMKQYILSTF